MDIVFEFIVEFAAELYFEFITSIIPQKNIGKGLRLFLNIICATISIGTLACIIIGSFLVASEKKSENIIGIVLLALSAAAVISHVIIAIVTSKNKKKYGRMLDKESLDENNIGNFNR